MKFATMWCCIWSHNKAENHFIIHKHDSHVYLSRCSKTNDDRQDLLIEQITDIIFIIIRKNKYYVDINIVSRLRKQVLILKLLFS